jgi:hypothetical protein
MLRLLIPLFFLFSCSEKNINNLGHYKIVDEGEKKSDFPKKYSVSVSGDEELKTLLFSSENIQISEKSEFLVSVSKKSENLGGEKLFFGVIEIQNLKNNFREKRISFSGKKSELEKSYQKVLQFFSKKRGFILEKREDIDGETIFKINLGNRDGVSENMRVDIFSYRENTSFLRGETKNKKEKIATAVISNIIEDEFSWIVLENKKLAKRVFDGDEVYLKKGDFSKYLLDGKLFIKTNSDLIENRLR